SAPSSSPSSTPRTSPRPSAPCASASPCSAASPRCALRCASSGSRTSTSTPRGSRTAQRSPRTGPGSSRRPRPSWPSTSRSSTGPLTDARRSTASRRPADLPRPADPPRPAGPPRPADLPRAAPPDLGEQVREGLPVEAGDPEGRERLRLRLEDEEAQLRVVERDGGVLEERLDERPRDGVVQELPERGLGAQRQHDLLTLDLDHRARAQ